MLQSRYVGRGSHAFLLAVIAPLTVQSLSLAGTDYWGGGTDLNWTTAANWSRKALPGSTDDVVLDEQPFGSSYTVTLSSGSQSINSLTADSTSGLTLTGGSLTVANASEVDSTLTLSGSTLTTLTEQGNLVLGNLTLASGTLNGAGNITIENEQSGMFGGTMSGTGQTTVASTGALGLFGASSGSIPTFSRVLENMGQITFLSGNPGSIAFNGGTLNNDAGAFVSIAGNETTTITATGGTNAFNNSGTLTASGNGAINIPFNNNGAVKVTQGTLSLGEGGMDTGSFSISSGATLTFSGGNHTFNSSTTVVGGSSGSGTVSFTAVTVNLNGVAANGNNSFAFPGSTSINGGTVSIASSNLAAGTSLTLGHGTLTGGDIVDNGAFTWGGTNSTLSSTSFTANGNFSCGVCILQGTDLINNCQSATLTTSATSEFAFATSAAGIAAVFQNNGVLTATGAFGGADLNPKGAETFNNAGVFDVINVTGDQLFTFDSGGPILNNTGTINVQNTWLLLQTAITQFNPTNMILTGGTWNIIAANGLDATLQTSSGKDKITTIASAASVTLDGALTTFTDINSLTTNQGFFCIKDSRNFTPTAAFSNSGMLKIGLSSTFEATTALSNTGTIDVDGGELKLDQGLATGTVRDELLSGFNGGAWNGVGIISSLAAIDPHHATGVGYVVNSLSDTLKDTWLGDTDLNGVVNNVDLLAMTASGTTWSQGDFNYDGVVNADDYTLFMLGDTEQTGSFPAVPEPVGMAMLSSAMFFVGQRRKGFKATYSTNT